MSLDASLDTDGIRNTTPTTLPFPEIALTMNVKYVGLGRRASSQLGRRRPPAEPRTCSMTVVGLAPGGGTKINATWNVTRP